MRKTLCILFLLLNLIPLPALAQNENWNDYRHELDGDPPLEYYVVEPSGVAPESGWRVLIALHGAGGGGLRMVQQFAPTAREQDVLLIAPTLDYTLRFDTNVTQLAEIIAQVGRDFEIDARGVVLYGISAGAGLASYILSTDFEGVLGVVLEGSPRLYTPSEQNANVPCQVVYGENDALRNAANLTAAANLMKEGFPVRYEMVRAAGHQITERGRDLSFGLVREVGDEFNQSED